MKDSESNTPTLNNKLTKRFKTLQPKNMIFDELYVVQNDRKTDFEAFKSGHVGSERILLLLPFLSRLSLPRSLNYLCSLFELLSLSQFRFPFQCWLLNDLKFFFKPSIYPPSL